MAKQHRGCGWGGAEALGDLDHPGILPDLHRAWTIDAHIMLEVGNPTSTSPSRLLLISQWLAS